MNGRFFDSRKLKCDYWDGKTDYKKPQESRENFQERVDQFGDWLEGQELPEEFQIKKESGPETVGNLLKARRDEKLKQKRQKPKEMLAL